MRVVFVSEKDYRDQWFFKRPDGRAVPACGYRAEDMRDDEVDATDEYFHDHTSAEGFADSRSSAEGFFGTHTSAEGFSASLPNRPPRASPAMTASQNSP